MVTYNRNTLKLSRIRTEIGHLDTHHHFFMKKIEPEEMITIVLVQYMLCSIGGLYCQNDIVRIVELIFLETLLI